MTRKRDYVAELEQVGDAIELVYDEIEELQNKLKIAKSKLQDLHIQYRELTLKLARGFAK